jgi:hypothetical protein
VTRTDFEPTSEATLLLRACLQCGEPARVAFLELEREVGDLVRCARDDRLGLRRLLPLLYDSIRRNEITVDRELQTLLRTSHVREQLRWDSYREILAGVLHSLTKADVPVLVIRGAAFVETLYNSPAHRHCHDIDLLIEDEPAKVVAALAGQGFRAASSRECSNIGDVELIHGSGLPLVLHRHVLPTSSVLGDFERSLSQVVAGVASRVLSPVDQLLLACMTAKSRDAKELFWACDIWRMLMTRPDLAWSDVVRGARDAGVSISIASVLRFLSVHLAAPIPETILTQLEVAAEPESLG